MHQEIFFVDIFRTGEAETEAETQTMELSGNEFLYVEKCSLSYTKLTRKTCQLLFNEFTYIAFLQKLKYLLPFALNPTPRQFNLILKFQKEAIQCELQSTDFLYPCMTKKMTTLMKRVCEATNFCRTEMFIQKHFLGLNLPCLQVLCALEKLTPTS